MNYSYTEEQITKQIIRLQPIELDNVAVIIQARMLSERLPGKILEKIGSTSMLQLILDRFAAFFPECPIVVATTTRPEDDIVEHIVNKNAKVMLFRGSELDVLERYYQACLYYNIATCIRVTSDCPFIDPNLIRLGLDIFQRKTKSAAQYSYLSNTLVRSFPRGFDFEIFSFDALQLAWQKATTVSEKEHVTLYLYQHRDVVHCDNLELISQHQDGNSSLHEWRLTVDTKDDLDMITLLADGLQKSIPLQAASFSDICRYMLRCPELKNINNHIQQKKV